MYKRANGTIAPEEVLEVVRQMQVEADHFYHSPDKMARVEVIRDPAGGVHIFVFQQEQYWEDTPHASVNLPTMEFLSIKLRNEDEPYQP